MAVCVSDTAQSSWTFAQVPDDVLYSSVSDRAIRLFAILHKHSTLPLGAIPGRKRLAELLGNVSLDSVDRAINELTEAGFVQVEARPGTSNLYTLTPTSVAAPQRLGSRNLAAPGSRTHAEGGSRTGAALMRSDLREKEVEREVSISEIAPIEKMLRESLGIMQAPIHLLTYWHETYTLPEIAEAIGASRERGKRSTAYVDGVLKGKRAELPATNRVSPTLVHASARSSYDDVIRRGYEPEDAE